ncbi:MAG: alkane 1-monooxygenase [Daejeonella sp.]|uniref:alkane 1-monooxygenase n=1 Tax=Daejeonella sp. TaxID=2805397 RepID=UPI002733E999|nr:alkane 1-monooxygenase [Daejeonella sp.]MDP3468892.1 alkane 1-monooxygenase [Daejeonella sp.]
MHTKVKRTGRSFRNWKYFLNLIPVILVIFGNLSGGWFTLLNFTFSFIVLGIAEILLPEDHTNDDWIEDELPDTLMFLSVAGQISALLSLIYGISTGIISGYWIITAALSTGGSSGTLAIVVAHELIHRKHKIWNFAGRFLLFTVFNPYFYIHHLRIHHKYVGTDQDPVTAKFGENYYHFVGRSISGQMNQSMQMEIQRCKINKLNPYGFNNYLISCISGYLGILLLSMIVWGWEVSAALVLQAIFANLLLEYTNYIEHYGLSRMDNERVNEKHSWQSDKLISRFLLIDLSRHSDHHFHASKPFNQLLSYPDSPVLPGGYASMILPALIPPLWFKLVNNKIPKHFSQKP